nr:hypothetical protein [Bradyrhizobium yuanmingense]
MSRLRRHIADSRAIRIADGDVGLSWFGSLARADFSERRDDLVSVSTRRRTRFREHRPHASGCPPGIRAHDGGVRPLACGAGERAFARARLVVGARDGRGRRPGADERNKLLRVERERRTSFAEGARAILAQFTEQTSLTGPQDFPSKTEGEEHEVRELHPQPSDDSAFQP